MKETDLLIEQLDGLIATLTVENNSLRGRQPKKKLLESCLACARVTQTAVENVAKSLVRQHEIGALKKKVSSITNASKANWMLGRANPDWRDVMGTDAKCIYCPAVFDESQDHFHSFTVDHLIPESVGGLNTTHNLVPSCAACNSLKADWTPPVANAWKDRKTYLKAAVGEVTRRRVSREKKFVAFKAELSKRRKRG